MSRYIFFSYLSSSRSAQISVYEGYIWKEKERRRLKLQRKKGSHCRGF